jgi:acylphosphatase
VEQARALALTGWVRNREDGCVEGVASGAAVALERLRAWLRRGPPSAQVEDVEWSAAAGEPVGGGFVIRP